MTVSLVFAGLFVCAAVLMCGVSNPLGLKSNCFFFLAVASSMLYLAYYPSGTLGVFTSFCATLALFSLQLAWIWHKGTFDHLFILLGLFPSADVTCPDAAWYYNGALHLLEKGSLGVVSSRRPLFPGLLATISGLTQQNLQVTVAVIMLITACACFFFAREVQRSHGRLAGVSVLAILFMFYRRFIGVLSTESLGLAFGATGMAVLWRGLTEKRVNLCVFGIFIFTLALNARAGAFFVLPALVIWGWWAFRERPILSRRFLIYGIGAVLLGFGINYLIFYVVSAAHSFPYANFAPTLYGMLVGKNWGQAFIDHPELGELSEDKMAQSIYAMCAEILRAHPMSILVGSLRAWKIVLLSKFIFSYMPNIRIIMVLRLLSLIALLRYVFSKKSMLASFILFFAAGVFFSIPFAPPWDGGVRIYAATIPFFALMPSLGLSILCRAARLRKAGKSVVRRKEPAWFLPAFSLLLILLCCCGPIIIKAVSKVFNDHAWLPVAASLPGNQSVYFRTSSGSSINLVPDDAISKSYVPNIRISDFRSQILKRYGATVDNVRGYSDMHKFFDLGPHTSLLARHDLVSGRYLLIVVKSDAVPKKAGLIVEALGRRSEWLGYVFFADSIAPLSEGK